MKIILILLLTIASFFLKTGTALATTKDFSHGTPWGMNWPNYYAVGAYGCHQVCEENWGCWDECNYDYFGYDNLGIKLNGSPVDMTSGMMANTYSCTWGQANQQQADRDSYAPYGLTYNDPFAYYNGFPANQTLTLSADLGGWSGNTNTQRADNVWLTIWRIDSFKDPNGSGACTAEDYKSHNQDNTCTEDAYNNSSCPDYNPTDGIYSETTLFHCSVWCLPWGKSMDNYQHIVYDTVGSKNWVSLNKNESQTISYNWVPTETGYYQVDFNSDASAAYYGSPTYATIYVRITPTAPPPPPSNQYMYYCPTSSYSCQQTNRQYTDVSTCQGELPAGTTGTCYLTSSECGSACIAPTPPPSICNNGTCEAGENCSNCPQDCKPDPPGIPLSTTCSALGTTVNLSWGASSCATSYNIRVNSFSGNSSATAYNAYYAYPIVAGTTYSSWNVAACNAAGCSSQTPGTGFNCSNSVTPWIQTNGDIHSNSGINAPGGP